jgi:uncharacterized protein (TIGR03545 family)
VVAPEQERGRGVVIDLLGDQRQPDILIRRCRVQGMMRADGNAYNVTGVVENLTPTPSLLVQPLHAQLQLDGPELVRLDYVRDRRGHNDIDRLTLHWPQSRASELTLGDDQHARVAVRGGNREVWVQMRSEADRVEGRFVSKQTGVQLSLQVDSKFAELPATVALRESLAAVDSVTIDAGFQGTWRQMSMDVNTNLGHLLRDAVEQAVAKQVDASKQQLARQVQQAYQDEQAELRRWFQQKQLDTQSLTAKADELLEDLGRELIDGVESSDVTIGRINDFLNGRLR